LWIIDICRKKPVFFAVKQELLLALGKLLRRNQTMKPSASVFSRQSARRVQRGAALIYALVAVVVIATLTLATGRLIGHHLALEQNAEGYARAINIAEAGANWWLNRMSRSKLPGDPTNIPGRLSFEEVNTWNEAADEQDPYIGGLPASETGTTVDGNVTVWVRSAALGAALGRGWTPPENFRLWSIGTDPRTGIRRGVGFSGRAIGLSDQYALFGMNELHFDSQPTEAGSDAGAARINAGYIGSNTRVTSRLNSPTPTGGALYFGCRLGPEATLQPTASAWAAGWDFPRLPDPVRWPSVEQVIGFMYRGRTVGDCATQNDNAQIDVMDATGNFVPLRESGGANVDRLTATQFDRSTHSPKTIRIRATETAANGNLFYFTQVQMRPDDVLILDLRKLTPTPAGPEHSIRILVNNPTSANDITITNLAYFDDDVPSGLGGEENPDTQSYFWFNNTMGRFVFKPERAFQEHLLPQVTGALFHYELDPTLRGLVYGLNANTTDATTAGDIVIYGKAAFPVTVRSLVGNHVRLLGPVQVTWMSAEDMLNLRTYVLYYSVTRRDIGEFNPNFNPYNLQDTPGRTSQPYDYGR
jgi:Tfp pilus assembly protein PilV